MDDDTPTPLTPRQVLRQADALRALVKNAEEVLHALNMGGYDNNWLLVHPADSRVERRQAVSCRCCSGCRQPSATSVTSRLPPPTGSTRQSSSPLRR